MEISEKRSSEEEKEEPIFDANSVPAGTDAYVSKPGQQKLTLSETRETLLSRNDNHIIFIDMNGRAVCDGAREYEEARRMPRHENLMYERAKVRAIGTKVLIFIPLKFNNSTRVETENIRNCLKVLVDVVNEK